MFKRIVIFIACLAVISAFPNCRDQKEKAPGNEISGTIIFISGTVILNGKNAAIKDVIKYGDVLETRGDRSMCEFLVGDKNIFRLKGGGRLIYKFTRKVGIVEVEKGWFAGLTKLKKLWQGDFSVITPTMVASIRGTSFCMKVEKGNQVYFCTCNGTVSLVDKNGRGRHDVSSAHHSAERYTLMKDGSISIERTGMMYHNDASMNTLAKKIGITIDWTRPSE